MSKSNIEALIPKAIEELEKVFGMEEIKSVYQGYISSFGVGIIQVGLLPTLAYFESEKEDASSQKGDRRIISDLVRCTMGITDDISLLTHAINTNNKETLKEKIKDASLALKLSMNLFDLGKGGQL